MKKNIKGIVGHLLIILGISLPLIGFWGMSYNNLMSQRDYENFKEEKFIVDENLQKEIKNYNEDIKMQNNVSIVDPFTANGYESSYDLENIKKDEIFSYLIIPKLNLVRPIYLGATENHLSKGLAQIDGTSLPVGGESTRTVIAGHRGWYNDVMFLYLDDLEEGDVFYIDGGRERLVYEVTNKEIIGPSDWEKLGLVAGEDIVTLLTCEPFKPPRPDRLLINAKRVVTEASENENLKTVEVSKTAKQLNLAIYIITVSLLLALCVSIFSFIKYLRR